LALILNKNRAYGFVVYFQFFSYHRKVMRYSLLPLFTLNFLLLSPAIPLYAVSEKPYRLVSVSYFVDGEDQTGELAKKFGNFSGTAFESDKKLTRLILSVQNRLLTSRFFSKTAYERFETETPESIEVTLIFNLATRFIVGVTMIPSISHEDSPYGIISLELNNVTGNYMANIAVGGLYFPLRRESWQVFIPEVPFAVAVSQMGNFPYTFGFSAVYSDSDIYVYEDGEAVFRYHTQELRAQADFNWQINELWQLKAAVKGTYAFNTHIRETETDADAPSLIGTRPPYYFIITQQVGFAYRDAFWQNYQLDGNAWQINVGYHITRLVQEKTFQHDFSVYNKYSRFWRVGTIFNPSVSALFYYKTGEVSYDLGRFLIGVNKSAWQGNGGIFLVNAMMFKVVDVREDDQSVFQMHMGPVTGFGFIFTPGRSIISDDYGFVAGLRFGFASKYLNGIPFLFNVAFDLRKTEKPLDWGRRFEISLESAYSF
jgi:hypothetical protein